MQQRRAGQKTGSQRFAHRNRLERSVLHAGGVIRAAPRPQTACASGLRTIDIPARIILHAGQPIHAAPGGYAQQEGLRLVACAISTADLQTFHASSLQTLFDV